MHKIIRIKGKIYQYETLAEMSNHAYGWEKDLYYFAAWLTMPQSHPIMFQTSGSTGTPKEIYFKKEEILHAANRTNNYFKINKNANLLLALPCQYVAGRMMVARAWASSANLIPIAPTLCPEIPQHPTLEFAAFTPAQFQSLLDCNFNNQLHKISKIILGGGPVHTKLKQSISNFQNQIYATYGMTETLTHVAVQKLCPEKWDSFHSIHPEIRFSINDAGCLIINEKNHCIVTNDMIKLITPSSFEWLGRADNVINSGGIKIHPEQMEYAIVQAGLLAENTFYISSKSNEKFGEKIVLVSTQYVNSFTLNQINNLFNHHKKIHESVQISELQTTRSGKIIRDKF
ncbi:MAG: AMP-binding protein [Candidatus Competibacteraceae bacterium]|nr:AMP-binding protein [Candidatus Competibacteraceae bacterium]